MKKIIYTPFIILLSCLLIGTSCRKDQYIFEEELETIPSDANTKPSDSNPVLGFYMLNEGNMGMNRASIDFVNYSTNEYHRDIYSNRNPNVVKELGDVGNDIQIYGNKLYAVINVSNYIEVMDAKTAKHIGRISIPNCRYIRFHEGKAYVSSYAGKVEIDPNAEIGFVAEIDTVSLEVTRKVTVGYQPEQMVIKGNKLYVANSGGYRVPHYDRTVSVVDLTSFQEIKKIDVGINLHRMLIDSRGDIYVTSRGDYYDIPASLYIIDSEKDEVKQHIDLPIGGMTLDEDYIYFYSVAFNYNTGQNTVTYGIFDTRTKELISDKLVKSPEINNIVLPHGLAIHPVTKDILITDAQNYVVSGYLYCFSADGEFKWKKLAGNIPAHFAFLIRDDKLKN